MRNPSKQLSQPKSKDLRALAQAAHSETAAWQSLDKLLAYKHQQAQELLTKAHDPVQIHRTQGELAFIASIYQTLEDEIELMRKEA